ncbi:MAG: hypothetical protein RSE41_10955 [Clostridia bacterium]
MAFNNDSMFITSNLKFSEFCEEIGKCISMEDEQSIYDYLSKYYNVNTRHCYSHITNQNRNTVLNSNQGNYSENIENTTAYLERYVCGLELNNLSIEYDENKQYIIKGLNKLIDYIKLSIDNNRASKLVLEKLTNSEVKNDVDLINDKVISLDKNIELIKQNIYSQLISIVAIFTAVSFVIFGGLTSISTLFDVARSRIDLTNTIALGCLFGIILINSTYIFLRFVLIILDKNNESVKMTKTIVSANVIILLLLIISLFLSLFPEAIIKF